MTARAIESSSMARTAKTHKGRKILKAKSEEPYATVKRVLLVKGGSGKCSIMVQRALEDIRDMKKPASAYLPHALESVRKEAKGMKSTRKNKLDDVNDTAANGNSNVKDKATILPFESADSIERLCQKAACGLFCVGSTSKKHPARLTMGRVYGNQVLDMYEFDLKQFRARHTFAAREAFRLNSIPLVLLQGNIWQDAPHLEHLKNYLLDFFRGVHVSAVNAKLFLHGVDRLITISGTHMDANSNLANSTPTNFDSPQNMNNIVLSIRQYLIKFSDQGKTPIPHVSNCPAPPKVTLEEVGPFLELGLTRYKVSTPETWKSATRLLEKELRSEAAAARQAKDGKRPVLQKSVKKNAMGNVVGKVHVQRADFTRLNRVQNPTLYKLQRQQQAKESAD